MKRFLLIGLLFSGVAAAQTQGSQIIQDNNRTYRIACSGTNDVISVRGYNNIVTLTGVCENLVIYGNSNTVMAVTLKDIWLRGNDNVVTASQQTQAPRISNTGEDNRYSVGTAVSGPTSVSGSAQQADDRDEDDRDDKGKNKKGKKDKNKGNGKGR
ncbi:DUF3060 domain-containing protein [Deinococcus malanensis]|nr:DUF3060 domain-containing protein [Deinococcus malanensis]